MIWNKNFYDERYIEYKKNIFQRDEFLTNLLLNKGIYTKEEADDFLNPNFKQLHDPFLLDNMEEVVNKILSYRHKDKKVLIFGDYDIDGMAGAVYLSKILNKLDIKNKIYIPNRSIFRYSLDNKFYDYLDVHEISLVISVDNSFGENREINNLLNKNIDLIITDHHLNSKEDTNVLEINPKKSSRYPFKELSGSGVVFKLTQAIYSKIDDRPISDIYEYCELIALATIADVMECSDENRFLIKRGLKNFSRTKILAFKMIMENLKIEPSYININDVSYRIAPLLNAIGKLDDPLKIIRFLTSESKKENERILNDMYEYNFERKRYESILYNKILEHVDNIKDNNINYIYYEINDISLGILGSITSKIALEYKIPVVVVSKVGGYCKGSCRSVDNKNIYKVIEEFSDYFINYGGHDLATGFLITAENLNLIRNDLKYKLNKLSLISETKDEIFIDAKLKIEDICLKKMTEINSLGPFGLSNSEPNFYDDNIKFSKITIFGVNNKHFKASIYRKGKEIQVLGYNLTSKLHLKKCNKLYKIIYTPELVNKKTIRLKLKDIE